MSTPFEDRLAVPPAAIAAPRRPNAALRAFLRNPSAMAVLLLLIAVATLALAAPWLFPGDPLDMVASPLLWPFQDAAFP